MTQAHIKLAPLILERKTPAEELREIIENAPYQAGRRTMEMVELVAARLEAPDEPKRWDGMFPWVSNYANVHFSPVLRWHLMSNGTCIYTGEAHEGDKPSNKSPYYDGVIITITAGDGTEFPRVVKAKDQTTWLCCGVGQGKSIYLEGAPNVFTVGDIPGWLDTSLRASPLPPGSVTRITISNHGATTEERYSVEVVEPEKPKFAPITVANERVKVGVESEKIRMDYLTLGGSQIFSADEAREIRDALSAALEFGNPTWEQPATEAVGLPLEIACEEDSKDSVEFFITRSNFFIKTKRSDGCVTVIKTSPADEARLRNLLNQRHADGKGGAE